MRITGLIDSEVPETARHRALGLAIVGAEGASRYDYTASEDDVVLVDGVSSHTYRLGYFGYAYYLANRDRLKAVAVDSGYGCVLPSPQSVADASYQPLPRPIFIYVKQSAASRPIDPSRSSINDCSVLQGSMRHS